LNALFNGRFIITNAVSLGGTELESLCYIAENAKQYIEQIREIKELSFSENEIFKRKEILDKLYDNGKNAKQLMKWL
jgi:hypothetical protein